MVQNDNRACVELQQLNDDLPSSKYTRKARKKTTKPTATFTSASTWSSPLRRPPPSSCTARSKARHHTGSIQLLAVDYSWLRRQPRLLHHHRAMAETPRRVGRASSVLLWWLERTQRRRRRKLNYTSSALHHGEEQQSGGGGRDCCCDPVDHTWRLPEHSGGGVRRRHSATAAPPPPPQCRWLMIGKRTVRAMKSL